jgi:hypothetical protein
MGFIKVTKLNKNELISRMVNGDDWIMDAVEEFGIDEILNCYSEDFNGGDYIEAEKEGLEGKAIKIQLVQWIGNPGRLFKETKNAIKDKYDRVWIEENEIN